MASAKPLSLRLGLCPYCLGPLSPNFLPLRRLVLPLLFFVLLFFFFVITDVPPFVIVI
jgi:hypothetical protein